METSDILLDPEIALWPETRTRVESLGLPRGAAVPLLATDRVLGVLAIYHAADFAFPPRTGSSWRPWPPTRPLALENARLFGEIPRRQETAEALAAITQTLTASLDLRTVLAGVADGVRELFGADGGAIGLVTRRGTMRLAARVGLGSGRPPYPAWVVGPGQGGDRLGAPARPALSHERLRARFQDRPDPRSRDRAGGYPRDARGPRSAAGRDRRILYGFWSQPNELWTST